MRRGIGELSSPRGGRGEGERGVGYRSRGIGKLALIPRATRSWLHNRSLSISYLFAPSTLKASLAAGNVKSAIDRSILEKLGSYTEVTRYTLTDDHKKMFIGHSSFFIPQWKPLTFGQGYGLATLRPCAIARSKFQNGDSKRKRIPLFHSHLEHRCATQYNYIVKSSRRVPLLLLTLSNSLPQPHSLSFSCFSLSLGLCLTSSLNATHVSHKHHRHCHARPHHEGNHPALGESRPRTEVVCWVLDGSCIIRTWYSIIAVPGMQAGWRGNGR